MNDKRPVNLALTTIAFPITAIASILHRISGIVLFFAVPFLLWLLQGSLNSASKFNELHQRLSLPWCKVLVFLLGAALLYHLVAGVRHLLMDLGIGETKTGGRVGAWLVVLIAIVLVALLGVALWGM